MKEKEYRIVIGIDPGTSTGFAWWDCEHRKLISVETMKIHQALLQIWELFGLAPYNKNVLIRIEDARQRKFFGRTSREVLQGAGSIKRDCVIWEDFCKAYGIDYNLVHPRDIRTKIDAKTFEQYTGWTERTSEHSRDAAMLVFNFN